MNRLEIIKERLDNVQTDHNNTGAEMDAEHEFENNAQNDISYLLQRLEIAQKALEVAVKKMESDDHVTYNGIDFVPTHESSEEYIFIKQALDQLKE